MDNKVDYGSLKKGGFMRQKQKDHFSLDIKKYRCYITNRTDGIIIIRHIGFSDMLDRIEKY